MLVPEDLQHAGPGGPPREMPHRVTFDDGKTNVNKNGEGDARMAGQGLIPVKDTAAIALAYCCERLRDSIERVDHLPWPVYNFDPRGWDLFVIRNRGITLIGGSNFVAVERSTGEVRDLGQLGE